MPPVRTSHQCRRRISPRQKPYYGFDSNPIEQYFDLLWKVLHGDFGYSASQNAPVLQLITERLPDTLALGGLAILLSLAAGVGFGYLVSYIRWRPLKLFLIRLPSIPGSLPAFWVGLLLIHVFAFTLGWLPSTGNDGFKSLILPAITLSLYSAAVYAQVLIRGFQDVWREPYIATAYAKGLSRGEVQFNHAFKNAVLPILTLLGLEIGRTMSGTVLIEIVFTRIGVGHLAVEAVLRQDIPVVLAIVTLSAAAFVVVNLIVDLLYPVFDPRILRLPRAG